MSRLLRIAGLVFPGLLFLSSAGACQGEDRGVALQPPLPGAELLYRLAKFIQWPPDVYRPGKFVVGLLGRDPAEPQIGELLTSRFILGRQVVVRHVSSPAAMRQCQILFIGRSLQPQVRQILRLLDGASVLTVAVMPGFGEMGGMVELSAKSRRRPLILNARAARRSGFLFSAELASVATIARTEGSPE